MKSKQQQSAPRSPSEGRAPSIGQGDIGNAERLQRMKSRQNQAAKSKILAAPTSPLPFRKELEEEFGTDLGDLCAHSGMEAEVGSLGAEAVAIGNHIAFADPSPKKEVVAEEVAHTFQQGDRDARSIQPETTQPSEAAEHEAKQVAQQLGPQKNTSLALKAGAPRIHRSAVSGIGTVLSRASKWLFRWGTAKQISKHIAKHGRNIAGKAVHSIFKAPNKIRQLVVGTVDDAMSMAGRHAGSSQELIEEAGLRVSRQTMGGGKFRWIIEKEFKDAIGTKGERFLKIVVDASGRIVTAYPVERLTALGLGVAAMSAFDSHTAEASTGVQEVVEQAAEAEENAPFDWGSFIVDMVMPIGFGAGSLNEGEELNLSIMRAMEPEFQAMLKDMEREEGRPLTEQEVTQLRELFEVAIGGAMMSQEEEE
jgi:hypothetical protein